MGGNPSYLNSGSSLTPGEQLTSLDGTFSLVLEANGNLLVQGPGGATIWQPSLSGSPIAGSQLSLSTTAELTLGTESATVWSANTGCNQNPTVLSMDDDAILKNLCRLFTAWLAGAGDCALEHHPGANALARSDAGSGRDILQLPE